MDMSMFMDLFGIASMSGTYEQRKVANTKRNNFMLDTAMVTDRSWTYETAVAHDKFNRGKWIILEGCDTKEEAEKMHNKWLEFLDKDDYLTLTDCYEGETFERNDK